MSEQEKRHLEIWATELNREEYGLACMNGIYLAKREKWQIKQNNKNSSFKAENEPINILKSIDFKPESKGEENK